MSEVFHIVEVYYADILRHGKAIERTKLDQDFHLASDIFKQYESVNRDVLGRSEDDSKLTIDREFLEKNFQIFSYLDQASLVDSDLQKVIHDNCDRLVEINLHVAAPGAR